MSLPLLHSPADILRGLIIGLGLGSDPDTKDANGQPLYSWPTYVSVEPSSPDNCLTVYDTTPIQSGRMGDGEGVYQRGFQIRIRSTTHKVGWVKGSSVEVTLNETTAYRSVTLDGTPYVVHGLANLILLTLGKDTPTSKRSLFTLNGTISLRRLS